MDAQAVSLPLLYRCRKAEPGYPLIAIEYGSYALGPPQPAGIPELCAGCLHRNLRDLAGYLVPCDLFPQAAGLAPGYHPFQIVLEYHVPDILRVRLVAVHLLGNAVCLCTHACSVIDVRQAKIEPSRPA